MPKKSAVPPLYPCKYPIKVIGECSLEFESGVLSVMADHVDHLSQEQIGRNVSAGGKYLSLTFHIIARNREHLEKLYAELNAREKVILVI
jgi:putative lipoic acid-binding regulatory protein